MRYDVIIIGAGPAGLSAALDCACLKLKALVLEADRAGGALSQAYPWKKVDSFLGFAKMTGKDIAARISGHVKNEGIEIREFEEVEEVKRGREFKIKTKKAEYEASAVIIATGVRGMPRKLSVPGENLEGVEYLIHDPEKFSGRKVLVVGGGDAAADMTLGLKNAGAKVWLAHRRDELRARDGCREKLEKCGVAILWNTEVESIVGETKVERVKLFNNMKGTKTEIACDHVLVSIGSITAKDWLEGIGIGMEDGLVKVDGDGMTSIPGIFAAGDIVSRLKRIPQALATGERAAYSAYKHLKNPYWK